MKKLLVMFFALPIALALSLPAVAQTAAKHGRQHTEHAYYGDISDSNCGAHHKMAGNERGCTTGCVKGGAHYVFVTGGKVLAIENQKQPELEKFAGEHVRVVGTKSADGQGITIASIRGATKRAAKKKA